MSRVKNVISILAAAFCVAAFAENTRSNLPLSNPVKTESKKPNIIFIMADDLGYGHLGINGQKEIETPEIDQLARQGMQFFQAYAGSTVCAPSRSVLMTGQHTGHTTVRGNRGPDGKRVPLNAEDVTVGEVMQSAGYRTGMIGKWGLGEPGTAGLPNDQGFDHWFGFLNQRKAHSFYPGHLWRNDSIVYYHENEHGQRETYAQDLFIEETLEFIRAEKDKPFFLYLPYTLPHTELASRPEIVERYRGKFDEVSLEAERGRPEVAEAKAEYAGMVTTLDYDVGRIMRELKKQGIADNTIVIFTSDNGAATEHGAVAEYFNGSGPFRGIKRDLYEGGIRVPLIVSWPNKIPAGKVDTTSHVAFWDFLPTFAELGGAKAPKNIDGISIASALNDGAVVGNDRPLYWEFSLKPDTPLMQAVRWGKWKAVRLSEKSDLEIYDLQEDLGETKNVAKQHPELVEKFETYLRSARN